MPTVSRSATDGRTAAAMAATAVAGALTGAVALGLDDVAAGPVLCPFRRLTGVPCPGCGLTRSVVAVLDGRVADAVGLHPAGPVLLVVALAVLVALLVPGGGDALRRSSRHPRLRPVAAAGATAWLAWATTRWS